MRLDIEAEANFLIRQLDEMRQKHDDVEVHPWPVGDLLGVWLAEELALVDADSHRVGEHVTGTKMYYHSPLLL